jgi:hypothetical protein
MLRKITVGLSALLAIACLTLAASPQARAQAVSTFTMYAATSQGIALGGTSPAAASTVVSTAVVGLDAFSKCVVYAKLAGATGGVLDVYLQSSTAQGAAGTWYDVAHWTQLTAAAAQAGSVVTLTRATQALTTVNVADATPVLAANTFLTGALGNALRVVYVAGASTSAGAAETISAICSTL